MGKPGAYLEQGRVSHGERVAAETIHDFLEFAEPLTSEAQRAQASRCMYCGVAFCQFGASFGRARTSGCPLHNLIPEWNDLLCRGLMDDAAERLSLTNPFPEFTGRVCPALCEAACNLGLNDEPTTIRDNERAISDYLWSVGGPAVLPAPAADAKKVAVIGAGPSGLATAWELARRGARVTLVDRADRAGGLLMYGIPNMKLPKDVVLRRAELMEKSGIELRMGVDAADAEVASALLDEFDAVVVAVGARAARRLTVPGSNAEGVVLAVDYLTAATKSVLDGGEPAISAEGLDVVVIGGGDTGTDCVATAIRQGATSVRQFEFLPEPPHERTATNKWPEWPMVRKDDYGQREAAYVFGEDPRTWAADTTEVLVDSDGHVSGIRVASLDWNAGKPQRTEGSEQDIPAQLVLIAMGFTGAEAGVFEALGVDAPGRGAARRASDKVFLAGDCRTGSSLVVNAIADGLATAKDVAEALVL